MRPERIAEFHIAESVCVPPGTLDNSPPFQRWDKMPRLHIESRQGRQNSAAPLGLRVDVELPGAPPLNRWASVGVSLTGHGTIP